MAEHHYANSAVAPARPEIVAYLAANPGGILEQVARDFHASTFDVVRALPVSHCVLLKGENFEVIMKDVTTWGEVLPIAQTDNLVLECKGAIPAGSFGRGYYNIHGDSPIGGHISRETTQLKAGLTSLFTARLAVPAERDTQQGNIRSLSDTSYAAE